MTEELINQDIIEDELEEDTLEGDPEMAEEYEEQPEPKKGKKEKNVKKEPLPDEKTPKLTDRQEIFCHYFAQDKECFGVGVRAYLKAYPTTGYDSAKASAYHLLTNPYILARIDELMDVFINEQVVDKELSRVILQSGNYSAKVRAINEWNKLKGRIVNRLDLTTKGLPLIDKDQKEKVDNIIDRVLNPNGKEEKKKEGKGQESPGGNKGDTGEQRTEKA